MPQKIFISYRRDDAKADARGLRDRLARAFGSKAVFMDVDNLLIGQRFDQELENALKQCDVFLAVIGPRWLDILKQRNARDERDYVREEIAAALSRGAIVIPVLVDDAKMPSPDDLPEDLSKLALYQAHNVSHARFGRDVDELVIGIKQSRKAKGTTAGNSPLRTALASLALLGITLAFGTYAYNNGMIQWPSVQNEAAAPSSGSDLPSKPTQPAGPTEEMIKEAQTLLKELGYDPGEPDGKRGVQTSDAIKDFQRDMGTSSRKIFGQVDDRLLGALRLAKRTRTLENRRKEREAALEEREGGPSSARTGRPFEVFNPASNLGFNYSNLAPTGGGKEITVWNYTKLCFDKIANPQAKPIDQRALVEVLGGDAKGKTGTLSMQVVRPLKSDSGVCELSVLGN